MSHQRQIFLVLAVLVLGVTLAGAAWAAPASSVAGAGSKLAGVTNVGLTAGAGILMVHAVLFTLNMLLNGLLIIVGSLLDVVFAWNVGFVPSAISFVPTVWGITRDIANGFLILIVLWIALTIIFGFDQLGGRKLLVRVVVVALLINFSLVFVTGLFGLANALASPFYTALNDGKISDFIANESKIHTAFNKVSANDIREFQRGIETEGERLTAPNFSIEGEAENRTNQGSALASALGIQEADAQAGQVLLSLGRLGGSLLPKIKGALGGVLKRAGPWAGAVAATGAATGLAVVDMNNVLSLAIQNFFLILFISSLLAVVILLAVRVAMMVFLSMLAPAALLLYAIPGKFGEQYWNMWLSSLLNWAFLAPAFYFLFYVSLLVYRTLNEGALASGFPSLPAFQENLLALINAVIFLVFLFAAVFIARKMAGAVGETAINWAKTGGKFVLGAAAGGVGALAARGAVAVQARPEVQQRMQRLAELPGLRWMGGAYPQRAAARFMEQQKKRIEEQEKDVKILSKNQAVADLGAAITPERKIALLRRIAEEGWIKDATDKYDVESMRRWLKLSSQYGAQKPILQAAPHLIETDEDAKELLPGATDRKDAIRKIIKGVDDRTKIAPARGGIYDADVMRGVVMNIRGKKELGRIDQQNAQLFQAMVDYHRANADELEDTLNRETPGQGTTTRQIIERYTTASPGRTRRGSRATYTP